MIVHIITHKMWTSGNPAGNRPDLSSTYGTMACSEWELFDVFSDVQVMLLTYQKGVLLNDFNFNLTDPAVRSDVCEVYPNKAVYSAMMDEMLRYCTPRDV